MKGPDLLVTSAYYKQFYQIGWFQLCLGRISQLWSRAVTAYHKDTHPNYDGTHWAGNFIHLVWKFTRQLWNHRNQIVHGDTVESTVTRQIHTLQEKVRLLYQRNQEEPAYILPRHEYLFTQRPLEYRLKLSYDAITCWIRSVEEAHAILDFQKRHHRETATVLFQSFRLTRPTSNINHDSDYTYIPSQRTNTTTLTLSRTNSTASMTDWSTSSADSTMSANSYSSTTHSSHASLISINNIGFHIPTGS
jgi:hypothetical protein